MYDTSELNEVWKSNLKPVKFGLAILPGSHILETDEMAVQLTVNVDNNNDSFILEKCDVDTFTRRQ